MLAYPLQVLFVFIVNYTYYEVGLSKNTECSTVKIVDTLGVILISPKPSQGIKHQSPAYNLPIGVDSIEIIQYRAAVVDILYELYYPLLLLLQIVCIEQ